MLPIGGTKKAVSQKGLKISDYTSAPLVAEVSELDPRGTSNIRMQNIIWLWIKQSLCSTVHKELKGSRPSQI